ncbi:hypothetical protein HZA33_05625 [Candidatus Pacearchaeota archaeon]|nr:hypothetical protein [Candidatus Pacearchaeota archaeon]
MESKINSILKEQIEAIKPSPREIEAIKNATNSLIKELNKKLKDKGTAFIGGSLTKNTLIRKERYDIDFFVRFSPQFRDKSEEMSNELEKVIKSLKIKFQRIHGSRDYFNLFVKIPELKSAILIEIVPVLKIAKPKEAQNITDLSFFHVSYVKRRLNEKLADEIRLSKSFCYSQNCYGAESHIRGFSGYALELLTIHYKSFIKLIKAASTWNSESKIVIDSEKFYKNKSEILGNLNEAKLSSPIVFIDPTFKERNVCASLSYKTFERFVNACKKFVSNPSSRFFLVKKMDLDEFKRFAGKNKAKLLCINAKIEENVESIAASKLFKFFNFLISEMKRHEFKVLKADWEFLPINMAKIYIVFKAAKKLIVKGPPIKLENFAKKFKQKYKKVFVRDKRLFAYSKCLTEKEFFKIIEKQIKAKEIAISFS